jgi:hypothetical protein
MVAIAAKAVAQAATAGHNSCHRQPPNEQPSSHSAPHKRRPPIPPVGYSASARGRKTSWTFKVEGAPVSHITNTLPHGWGERPPRQSSLRCGNLRAHPPVRPRNRPELTRTYSHEVSRAWVGPALIGRRNASPSAGFVDASPGSPEEPEHFWPSQVYGRTAV